MIRISNGERDRMRGYFNEAIAEKKSNSRWHEQVWTYLMADILCNSKLRDQHVAHFCAEDISLDDTSQVWFEARPLVPRKGKLGFSEGDTRLDLAFGSIRGRSGTETGIEFYPNAHSSWVCFVESKYFADQSSSVTHDQNRNQIIRILENLLCFQGEKQFPKRLFFVLITPRVFKQSSRPDAKHYNETFQRYFDNPEEVLQDIELSPFDKRNRPDWKYPESLVDRIPHLSMKWLTFEEIFELEYGISELDITRPEIHPMLRDRLARLADCI